ncbi:cysteine protease family C01A, partial [Achlya hypogyna]
MKSATCIASLAVLACTASALRLSAAETADLEAKLAAWKASKAGKLAETNGFVPAKTEHGKLEDGEVDDELARFAATQKIVDDLNAQHPGAEFSTDNQFALMTEDEFAAFVKGSFKHETRQLRSDTVARDLTAEQQQAGEVDWSGNKCMSPVRNQGSCGSCWSFAAVGAVEAAHCLATGQLVDFSEQQLVSCASSAGYGCQGGWPNKALDYIAQTGLCTESAFPYASGSSNQNGQCRDCQKTKVSVGKSVDISGESALQSALDKQPVTVVVEAGNNVWRNYKSGIVQSCPGAQSDHAVIAVGYGTKNGVQHFKIKNSWGTGWGEQGYIYLQRGRGGK